MAVHPLRPATDRRLGGPLPRQLPNQTRGHPVPPEFFTPDHAVLCAYAVLAVVSNCCPPVQGRFPTRYSPVRHLAFPLPSENFRGNAPFDLHVLSTPPAFILSQDQTLCKKDASPFVRVRPVPAHLFYRDAFGNFMHTALRAGARPFPRPKKNFLSKCSFRSKITTWLSFPFLLFKGRMQLSSFSDTGTIVPYAAASQKLWWLKSHCSLN